MSAPRPWRYDLASGWIEDANGEPLAHFDGGPEAQLVVRAVNAHADLVAAVRAAVPALQAIVAALVTEDAPGSRPELATAPRGPRLRVWPALALLGVLAGSAAAGDVTVQEAYPGSRLRPGSDANPYELRQDGRTLGRLEEESPPTRWLVPGSESNPYRVRPRRDAIDDGFDGFEAFDDEEVE